MRKTVVVPDLLDTLPFHEALPSWEKFQALCTDVLYKTFESADSREYLLQGSKQEGIDVYAVRRGEEKITVAQCKLKDYVGPKEVLDIIDEFLKGKLVGETREFILCTSADLGRQRDEDETIAAAKKKLGAYGIEFVVWDERGLSKVLRTNATPDILHIVYRYFGEKIALAFYGDLWIDYVKKFRKVEKHIYELPEDHIERVVESYAGQPKKETSELWYNWDKAGKTLAQMLEANDEKINKKIVLLSTAGYGKTQELENLAGYFSADDKVIYPIKFSLRNYVGQSIEAILSHYSESWQNIDPENILLLFDGLDEVGEHHSQTFIRNLNAFVEQNPNIKAVVSSRYNFYDVRHPQLTGFDIYLLNPLTHYDLELYLEKKLGGQADNFKKLLRERNFSDYSSNPYYLTRLVRFYKDDNSFPKNKSEFFQRVLFERLGKDEGTYNMPELKERLLPIAEQIAFCMTVAGKSNLTDEEMKTIIPDAETRRLLKHFGIINRHATVLGSWSFEHKNLQEYLCASVLSSSTFAEIHKLVSFEYNSNKIVPRFLNTLSFLFEVIDKESTLFRELFHWINGNEPEVLVRFEKEQLSKETRHSIFKHIFEYYEGQELTIRASSHFTHEELARFTEIDSSLIDYLHDKLRPTLPPSLVYDTIYLLEQCPRPYLYRESLTRILFSVVQNDKYPEFIRASAIMAFAVFGFTEQKTFESIFNGCIDLESYEIRKACIFFLNTTEYFEDYSQFILRSIPILEEGQQKSNSSGGFIFLKELLCKFRTSKAVKELFQYCITDKDCISRHSHYREFHFELKEVKSLLEQAVQVYKSDRSILPVIYRIYCGIEYISVEQDLFSVFKSFFEKTCGTRVIFQKFYKFDKREREIMSFADEWCCDFLIEDYKQGKITEGEMIVCRNVLSHVNWDLFLNFYEKLKTLNDGRFIIEDLRVDYNLLRQQQEVKNQQMLLDQSLFIEEAAYIFQIIAKENITTDDLWYSENKELRKYQNSIVIDAIRDLCVHDEDKIITKEQFFYKFRDSEQWEGFVIDSTFSLLKDKKEVVHPDLLNKIKRWCRQKIETLEFEGSIRDDGDSFTYIPIIEFVKDIVLLTDLDLEDELLLKMLPSDYETFYGWDIEGKRTLSSVIIEQLKDRELLHKTVIKNIKGRKLAVRVLCAHFVICHHLCYKECLPDLFEAITSHPLLSDYDRRKLTDFYLDLGGEIADFIDHLRVPYIEKEEATYSSWQWYLIEKLQFVYREKVTGILLDTLQSEHPDANKLKAAEHLILLSRIEGLEYWASYVKEKAVFPFEERWANLQASVAQLPADRAIDLFLSVLEFAYPNKLQDRFRGSYFIEEAIYTSLNTLSKADHQLFFAIKARITDMISRYASEPFVHSIKFYSERFAQRYYESQTQEVDVQKGNLIYLEGFQQKATS